MKATFWLLRAPDSLRKQSHREPDGTGLGTFAPNGTPDVSKQPLAAFKDTTFAQEARACSSRTFVGHIRFASTGAVKAVNTHPFEQQGRIFAHNGVLEGLDKLEAELGDAMSLVQGDTDSERLFALITKHAAVSGDLSAAIAKSVQWVARNIPLFAANIVMAQPDGLWALRYPETHELWVLHRGAGGLSGNDSLHHVSSIGTINVHADEARHRETVVVASEPMDDDPGWRLLEVGELVHVDGDGAVSSQIAVSEAPAHPLTLSDLDENAAASQKATTQHA